MFMKKFELTSETIINNGKTLYRIKALIDFSNIKAGELGGFVEKESNLYHKGNAWVYGNAKVSGDAKVSGNACVSGNTCISGNARVYGNADYTTISGFGTRFRTTTFFKCSDKKIIDVITRAGGLMENDDTDNINLSKKVTDEMVIIIYTNEEVKNSNIVDTVIKVIDKECVCPNIQNDGCINTEINDSITNVNKTINIIIKYNLFILLLPNINFFFWNYNK